MDWCVADEYDKANHPPLVELFGPLDIKAAPGQTVQLSAAESSDPDGDKVRFKWWQYREAGTCEGKAAIHGTDGARATVAIPSHAKAGQTVHIVCEVTDVGTPPSTWYQRVVVDVKP